MAEERVIKIGMLGLGTVGTGVYKVLRLPMTRKSRLLLRLWVENSRP